jgi:hypothetical protein
MSLPMAVSQWYGVDREGAFCILEQVEEDNEELMKRAPTLAPQPPPEEAPPSNGQPSANGKTGMEAELTGEPEDDTEVAEQTAGGMVPA